MVATDRDSGDAANAHKLNAGREILRCRQRELSKAELRLLRARAASARAAGRRATSAGMWVGLATIITLWLLTILASDAPVIVITAFWLVVGGAIVLVVHRSLRSDGRHLDAVAGGLESAVRRNLAQVYDIRASAFVEFEEIEDEGACYAFELAGSRVVFLQGQEFYATARFPSLDFSLVMPLDEGGNRVDMMIEARGPKANPQRVVASRVKQTLVFPDDLVLIAGTLTGLEDRLRQG